MFAIKQENIFKDLESEILKDEKGDKSRKSFNLLYSAKGDVDVDQFHAKCDGKGPTVTLIYGKYNTVFGGYTSQDWSSDIGRKKKDKRAFLFYKNDNAEAKCIIMKIKQDMSHKAITCDAKFGPTFGGGDMFWEKYDLQAFKRSSKKSKSDKDGCFYLNGEFCIGYAYQKGTSESEVNTNDINSGTLLVKTVEVYQVIDDTLKEPWRERPNDKEMNDMRKGLENLEPSPYLGIESFNILTVGVIGAGKSSFYNTLASVFADKIKVIAPAAEEQTSVTNAVHAYPILAEKKRLNIKIFDIRGFDKKQSYVNELEFILNGRLPPGYVFEDQPTQLKDTDLKKEPTLNDEIHLVCLVADITKLTVLSDELLKSVDHVKSVVRKKGLPLVAVATKFDQICPRIREDADHVYNSRKAEDATKTVSETFGIQLRHVFPIVNYIEDRVISRGKNRLALQALNTMVQLTQDHLLHHEDMPSNDDDTWSERLENLYIATEKEEREEQIATLSTEMSRFDKKKELRVFCIGLVRCGKSSFIDSILSALTGRISSQATERCSVAHSSSVSTTERFQLYQMKHLSKDGDLNASKVYFGDMPGISKDTGFNLEQAKRVVNGHVPNRYKVQDGIKEDSKFFIKTPELRKDQIRCVCLIVDISTLDDLSESSLNLLYEFKTWMINEEIPFIVVATKCDKASLYVQDNVMKVYENERIKASKDHLLELLRIKESRLFPVRNYVHERKPVPEFDALLLDAFLEVLRLGNDYLEKQIEAEEENTDSGPKEVKEDI